MSGIASGRFDDILRLGRELFDQAAAKDRDIRIMSSLLKIFGGKVADDAVAVRKLR